MILILGDTHGNFREFCRKLDKLTNNKHELDITILHVGDFGIGFKETERQEVNFLKELNNFLKERKTTMYAIRGNHDSPNYFTGEYSYSNLKLISDYTILNIDGKKILLAGGAVSIDRRTRLNQMQQYASVGRDIETYWFDEAFNLNSEILLELTDIDLVVTHSAPGEASPVNDYNNQYMSHGYLVESYSKNDSELKNDLNKERQGLSEMLRILKEKNNIKSWYYGHFHSSKKENIDGIEFVLVDCNEIVKHE